MRLPIPLLAGAALFGLGCADVDSSAQSADQAAVEAEFGRRPEDASAIPEDRGDEDRAERSEAPPRQRERSASPAPAPAPTAEDPTGEDPADEDPTAEDPVADPVESPPEAPTLATVDVDSLLAAADAAYAQVTSLRASFVQRMEVPLLDRVSEGRGMWYQRGSSHFRMDFTEPAGDVLVADGTHFWAYQPSQQPDQVIKSQLGGEGQAGTVDVLGQILSEARTSYASVYEGAELVSGLSTHVVTLTPLAASRYRSVRVWIAASDGLVRRFRIEEENESIRTVTLSELEPQVQLDDTLFQFTAPAGVQTFEG